ncbi:hypothetical protein CBS147353_8906 [Aspergillus niger]|nr:hypothetical protein CBS11852_5471 [Aspergillus niger]KAI3053053.1 hypothetical protein CBS147352_4341 [Aspergillus niger]KAI3063996.1 hypothetical protein CBS147353_8906 [Aspergillus niger]
MRLPSAYKSVRFISAVAGISRERQQGLRKNSTGQHWTLSSDDILHLGLPLSLPPSNNFLPIRPDRCPHGA